LARALDLARGLDPAKLRPTFERLGHLPGVFGTKDAQAVHAALTQVASFAGAQRFSHGVES
jgi:hypothetical protein